MDGADRFINQQRAEQDQAEAAQRRWQQNIPDLKQAAEEVVESFRQTRVTDVYVRASHNPGFSG